MKHPQLFFLKRLYTTRQKKNTLLGTQRRIIQNSCFLPFPDVLSAFNPFGGTSIHQTKNNRLDSVF